MQLTHQIKEFQLDNNELTQVKEFMMSLQQFQKSMQPPNINSSNCLRYQYIQDQIKKLNKLYLKKNIVNKLVDHSFSIRDRVNDLIFQKTNEPNSNICQKKKSQYTQLPNKIQNALTNSSEENELIVTESQVLFNEIQETEHRNTPRDKKQTQNQFNHEQAELQNSKESLSQHQNDLSADYQQAECSIANQTSTRQKQTQTELQEFLLRKQMLDIQLAQTKLFASRSDQFIKDFQDKQSCYENIQLEKEKVLSEKQLNSHVFALFSQSNSFEEKKQLIQIITPILCCKQGIQINQQQFNFFGIEFNKRVTKPE
ncbi:Hypothetical_protein [Hexamita inflata]|uniref:Hypothetical_protein n=1 Tax=Hexamita inflata TaxID=28002 RepID=A0AA86U3L7_9EUKA|nr:Hypothetical protein HINF_LOCUS26954 [Hexamita inflata]